MLRRTFVVALASLPVLGRAASAPRRVGILSAGSKAAEADRMSAFTTGMRDLGYIDGRDYVTEDRFAEGQIDALPRLAADLVNNKVDVIVCLSTLATDAARKATVSIPIVFATVADPVAEGFVKSLAASGNNLTGLATLGTELSGKGLELLKDAFPTVNRVVLFVAPKAPHASDQLANLESSAKRLGIAVARNQLRQPEDRDRVLSEARSWRADGMFVMNGVENSAMRAPLVKMSLDLGAPAIFPQRNYVEAGGLMSYGPSYTGNYMRSAYYVDKILRGARPSDLPIEQPSKFELVLNLRTAKALGVEFARSFLVRADTVLE